MNLKVKNRLNVFTNNIDFGKIQGPMLVHGHLLKGEMYNKINKKIYVFLFSLATAHQWPTKQP